MERVLTLCVKLQEQLARKESVDQLLLTVQMLQAELQHLKSTEPLSSASGIAFDIPPSMPLVSDSASDKIEKVIEVLNVDEAEIEAELEEIKKNFKSRSKIAVPNKPLIEFDPVEEIPTLTQQQPKETKTSEVHEIIASGTEPSLHDKLRKDIPETSDIFKESSIKDLKKGVGINERFTFINELFRGDEVMYERSIKTINGFSILEEAEYWIKRELKLKLGWDEENPAVHQFDQLIKRRFS